MKIIASLIPILCLSSSVMAQDMDLLITKEIDYYKYLTEAHPVNFQDTAHYQKDKFSKNAFYISGMVPIAHNSFIIVSYEHIINKNPYKFPLLLVRFAGGFHIVGEHQQGNWFGTGEYVESYTNTTFLNTLSILLGRNLLHLELSAGYCLYFWEDINELTSGSNSPLILPEGGIGLRYQKPGRSIIIRAGLAFPVEGLYLGFGGAF
jgi:hypothetical protein